MKEMAREWAERNERRRKMAYVAMSCGGIAAIAIGVASVAILAITGLVLLAMGIGSLLLGRFLLGQAKAWRQRHFAAGAGK
jgi:hypothetical protein